MEIRLRVDQLQPPTGQVSFIPTAGSVPGPLTGRGEGRERSPVYERPFTGWLELLAALSDLMGGSADRG
jgi:hypothetical protein